MGMKGKPKDVRLNLCSVDCSGAAAIDDWNRECFCFTVDPRTLHEQLDARLDAHGLPQDFAKSHPHLFSALPVYVSRRHIEQVAKVVLAIEQVTALPGYQAMVMAWAPEIAAFDPGSPGGLLGLDFHLGPDGPRLIEINTNPGGVLLNALLGEAQHAVHARTDHAADRSGAGRGSGHGGDAGRVAAAARRRAAGLHRHRR